MIRIFVIVFALRKAIALWSIVIDRDRGFFVLTSRRLQRFKEKNFFGYLELMPPFLRFILSSNRINIDQRNIITACNRRQLTIPFIN